MSVRRSVTCDICPAIVDAEDIPNGWIDGLTREMLPIELDEEDFHGFHLCPNCAEEYWLDDSLYEDCIDDDVTRVAVKKLVQRTMHSLDELKDDLPSSIYSFLCALNVILAYDGRANPRWWQGLALRSGSEVSEYEDREPLVYDMIMHIEKQTKDMQRRAEQAIEDMKEDMKRDCGFCGTHVREPYVYVELAGGVSKICPTCLAADPQEIAKRLNAQATVWWEAGKTDDAREASCVAAMLEDVNYYRLKPVA